MRCYRIGEKDPHRPQSLALVWAYVRSVSRTSLGSSTCVTPACWSAVCYGFGCLSSVCRCVPNPQFWRRGLGLCRLLHGVAETYAGGSQTRKSDVKVLRMVFLLAAPRPKFQRAAWYGAISISAPLDARSGVCPIAPSGVGGIRSRMNEKLSSHCEKTRRTESSGSPLGRLGQIETFKGQRPQCGSPFQGIRGFVETS
jgi:hypothetical protein